LAGIIVTALFQGVLTLIQIIAQPENVSAIVGWIAGRLNAVTWNHVLLSAPLAFAGMLGILLVRWRIFVLSMGDEEARALGMDVVKERLVVITVIRCYVPPHSGCSSEVRVGLRDTSGGRGNARRSTPLLVLVET
jgi:ABC-type Fe3+-siderophore transport system permease subunit